MNVKRLKKKKIVYRLQRNLAIDMQNIKVTMVVVKKNNVEFLVFSFLFSPLLHSTVAAAVKFLLSPTIQIRFVELRVSP